MRNIVSSILKCQVKLKSIPNLKFRPIIRYIHQNNEIEVDDEDDEEIDENFLIDDHDSIFKINEVARKDRHTRYKVKSFHS